MIDHWSIIRLHRGSMSESRMPGTLVPMVPNSPRYSTGASGLGSHMSIFNCNRSGVQLKFSVQPPTRKRKAKMPRIHIYDTTLRDGSQGEGINFSLQDKLLITRRLDELGVDYIEGGYPLSNPKDFEYFQEVRKLALRHARIAAFGMTRRKNCRPEDDTCLKALVDARTEVVTLVGKTWDMHVREVVGTTLEENLRMIADSVAHCKAQAHVKEVIYDAEHFFDGWRHNSEYA